MSYGIALRNEYNEHLVDISSSRTYYRKSSGTCIKSSAATDESTYERYIIPSTEIVSAVNGMLPYYRPDTRYPSTKYRDIINYASPRFGQVTFRNTDGPFDDVVNHPEPVSTNKDDLVFFKMPSQGIMGINHIWLPFTGTDKDGKRIDVGLFAMCVPYHTWTGTGLQYQVVSTDLPPRSGTSGLCVYDTNGAIMFDTTREIAQFADHFSISSAQVQNVLVNNATYNFSLRQPVINAWITAEGQSGSSYRIVYNSSNATLYALRILKTSTTNIQVSRAVMSGSSFNWANSTYQNYEAATFIVADFG